MRYKAELAQNGQGDKKHHEQQGGDAFAA